MLQPFPSSEAITKLPRPLFGSFSGSRPRMQIPYSKEYVNLHSEPISKKIAQKSARCSFASASTFIIRHRRENLKKCSLRGLEGREDMTFLRYPGLELPSLQDYCLLAMDGEPLSKKDANSGLLLLDGTWRYAEKMASFIDKHVSLPKRSLPEDIKTAYPRKQEDCSDPSRGLASVEALYVAYHILGRDTSGLLDHYFWRNSFLAQNKKFNHND